MMTLPRVTARASVAAIACCILSISGCDNGSPGASSAASSSKPLATGTCGAGAIKYKDVFCIEATGYTLKDGGATTAFLEGADYSRLAINWSPPSEYEGMIASQKSLGAAAAGKTDQVFLGEIPGGGGHMYHVKYLPGGSIHQFEVARKGSKFAVTCGSNTSAEHVEAEIKICKTLVAL